MHPNPSRKITHDASSDGFNYYGRWQTGRVAVSINSGSLVEFAWRGNSCTLAFDVRGFSHYPAIFVQADNGPIQRTTLSSKVDKVTVSPPYNRPPKGRPPFPVASSRYHVVRFWVATHSLYVTDALGKQWTTLVGGCRFRGADLKGGELIPLPSSSNRIEFIGDSITQGLRLLYTGKDDDTNHQIPYANWPQLAADLLVMKPIVTGFGGQGLTSRGTSGAPPTNDAFHFIHARAKWKPSVKPRVVVIYHGTNDAVSPQEFEHRYAIYLTTVRKAYPKAVIFAICPHNQGRYAHAIRKVVKSKRDKRIVFRDYSTGIIAAEDTCDGCHLNPGGAVVLATRVAEDVGSHPGI
jgi:lysophospholipase L1-like esterase